MCYIDIFIYILSLDLLFIHATLLLSTHLKLLNYRINHFYSEKIVYWLYHATCGAGTAYLSGASEYVPVCLLVLVVVEWCSCCHITCLYVFSYVWWWTLRFPRKTKTMVDSSWHLFNRGHVFYLVAYTYTCVQQDFHIRWCSCRWIVTRRVSHVEQELLTFPEHLRSPPFSVGFVLCFVDNCLCVLFWLTTSDYPFDIYKLYK